MTKPSLTKNQLLSVLKVAGYLALSAGISYLITWLGNNPESFGLWTPLVNVVLVLLQKMFSEDKKPQAWQDKPHHHGGAIFIDQYLVIHSTGSLFPRAFNFRAKDEYRPIFLIKIDSAHTERPNRGYSEAPNYPHPAKYAKIGPRTLITNKNSPHQPKSRGAIDNWSIRAIGRRWETWTPDFQFWRLAFYQLN